MSDQKIRKPVTNSVKNSAKKGRKLLEGELTKTAEFVHILKKE